MLLVVGYSKGGGGGGGARGAGAGWSPPKRGSISMLNVYSRIGKIGCRNLWFQIHNTMRNEKLYR